MTILHLRGVLETVELAGLWSGTTLVDYGGRLWRLGDAVENPCENRTDVYAFPLASGEEEHTRQEFANWHTTEPGPPAEKKLFKEEND